LRVRFSYIDINTVQLVMNYKVRALHDTTTSN
jgi:hypothetical protein